MTSPSLDFSCGGGSRDGGGSPVPEVKRNLPGAQKGGGGRELRGGGGGRQEVGEVRLRALDENGNPHVRVLGGT